MVSYELPILAVAKCAWTVFPYFNFFKFILFLTYDLNIDLLNNLNIRSSQNIFLDRFWENRMQCIRTCSLEAEHGSVIINLWKAIFLIAGASETP